MNLVTEECFKSILQDAIYDETGVVVSDFEVVDEGNDAWMIKDDDENYFIVRFHGLLTVDEL